MWRYITEMSGAEYKVLMSRAEYKRIAMDKIQQAVMKPLRWPNGRFKARPKNAAKQSNFKGRRKVPEYLRITAVDQTTRQRFINENNVALASLMYHHPERTPEKLRKECMEAKPTTPEDLKKRLKK